MQRVGRHVVLAACKSGVRRALDKSKVGLARRMHASGESASTIAKALGVELATGCELTV
jgi:DNA invertase Pin-like site-specific DNA recombinase